MRVLRGVSLALKPVETFRLDAPQDEVLVIEAGRASWR
jgi:hypothetical protein